MKSDSTLSLLPPKGTRDFFPDDMVLRSWLFAHFRETARLYGFEEYDAPVLEHEDLYVRKAGEEITDQLYNFEDKSGRRLALRPEMTPSLARLVMQKGRSAALPFKWFSIPQCFRYERMTRGRKREHYQWNMDIFGVPGVEAEAELLAAVVTFFQRLGLSATDVGINVSSRKVLQGVIDSLNVSAELFPKVCVVVDKLGKLPADAILQLLSELGLDKGRSETILHSLSLKSLADLKQLLPQNHEAIADLSRLFELADGYGYADWLRFDASIVRGLAYYTGIVFEGFDRRESLRAICGGGRYDKLLSMFGGQDVAACGFGFGDVVILEVLKDRNCLPALHNEVDDVVVALEPSLRVHATRLSSSLRAENRSVDLILEDRKLKWVLGYADRRHAKRIFILGPDEFAQGKVKVRSMQSGEESLVDLH